MVPVQESFDARRLVYFSVNVKLKERERDTRLTKTINYLMLHIR